MGDFRHHVIMVNYYQMISDLLEEKILKIRYITHKDVNMSTLEKKLRNKKIKIDGEIRFHGEMFAKNFVDGYDYVTEPSKDEIYEYVSLFKSIRDKKAEVIK